MSRLKKVVITLLIVVILIPIICIYIINNKLNSMYVKEDDNVSKTIETKADITNILVIGVDEEYLGKGSRSDTMIIMTIDNKNKSIKLT